MGLLCSPGAYPSAVTGRAQDASSLGVMWEVLRGDLKHLSPLIRGYCCSQVNMERWCDTPWGPIAQHLLVMIQQWDLGLAFVSHRSAVYPSH